MLGLSGSSMSAQRCHDRHHGHTRYDDRREWRHKSPYFITDNAVFFDGHEIDGASASSFTILHDGYAKDTWNVYYCGVAINGASSNSFVVLGYGYAKDTWNVYYDGIKINGASPSSFKMLGDGYAKDTWNTYYCGELRN